MANHKWVLSRVHQSSDRFRRFVCERCDAGPVVKDVLSSKSSIAKAAKDQGFSADCNYEVAKKIMES